MQTAIRQNLVCSNTLCERLQYWSRYEYPSDLRLLILLHGGGISGHELVVQVQTSMKAIQIDKE